MYILYYIPTITTCYYRYHVDLATAYHVISLQPILSRDVYDSAAAVSAAAADVSIACTIT